MGPGAFIVELFIFYRKNRESPLNQIICWHRTVDLDRRDFNVKHGEGSLVMW